MRTAVWVIAALLAITASAFAWRSTPTGSEPPATSLPTRTAPPKKPRLPRTPHVPVRQVVHAPVSRALHPPKEIVDELDEPVLAQLPADTLFVAAADRCQDTMDAIGLASLLATYGTEVDELERWLGGIPNVQTFDPTTWGAMGVDLNGPGGFAIVGFDQSVLVLFANVSDPENFRRAVEALFATQDRALYETTVDRGEGLAPAILLTPTTQDGEPDAAPEMAVVLRGARAFVVGGLDGREAVLPRAEQLALQGPEDALINDANVTGLIDQLELGGDGVAYANIRALVAGLGATLDREIDQRTDEMEKLPEDADRSWEERRLREDEAGRAGLNALLGGISGLALGLELGDGKAELDAVLALDEGSMLKRLLGSRRSTTIRRALPSAPLFLLDFAVDTATARLLTQEGFRLFGADYAQAVALAQATAGFKGDPFDLFTGEVSFAITPRETPPTLPTDETPEPDFMPFTITLVADVGDPGQAQHILDQLGGLATLAGYGEYVPATKGLALRMPYMPRFNFAIINRALVITSSPTVMATLASGGTDVASTMDPARAAYLPNYGQTGCFYMDSALFQLDARMADLVPVEPPPGRDGETAEERALRLELFALDQKLYREPAEKRAALENERASLVGAFGIRGTPDDTGLRLRAGWLFQAPTLAAVLLRLAEIDLEVQETWKENSELQERRNALQERLNALTVVDTPQVEVPLEPLGGGLLGEMNEGEVFAPGLVDPQVSPSLDPIDEGLDTTGLPAVEGNLINPPIAPDDAPIAPGVVPLEELEENPDNEPGVLQIDPVDPETIQFQF